MTSREAATAATMTAKAARGMSFEEIAGHIDRHEVWTATALLGQATFSPEEAATVGDVLGLEPDVVAALSLVPSRGAYDARCRSTLSSTGSSRSSRSSDRPSRR